MRKKVAMFFGGRSCENEISILTGIFILHLIDEEKYDPFPVYVHTDGGMYSSRNFKDLSYFKEGKFKGKGRIVFDGGTAYKLLKEKKLYHKEKKYKTF